MNRWEIDEAAARHSRHPVLGPATRFLVEFRDLVDSNSDGWCYWRAPVRACDRLFTLIKTPQAATPDALKRALTPIKSFCTRHRLAMPAIEHCRSTSHKGG
jgi:hypothetical protein